MRIIVKDKYTMLLADENKIIVSKDTVHYDDPPEDVPRVIAFEICINNTYSPDNYYEIDYYGEEE